jgi:hypothetical protein
LNALQLLQDQRRLGKFLSQLIDRAQDPRSADNLVLPCSFARKIEKHHANQDRKNSLSWYPGQGHDEAHRYENRAEKVLDDGGKAANYAMLFIHPTSIMRWMKVGWRKADQEENDECDTAQRCADKNGGPDYDTQPSEGTERNGQVNQSSTQVNDA